MSLAGITSETQPYLGFSTVSTKDRRGWMHETCPHCIERGAGPDRGKHLGRSGRYLHCLRCGYSGRLGNESNKGGRVFQRKGRRSDVDSRPLSLLQRDGAVRALQHEGIRLHGATGVKLLSQLHSVDTYPSPTFIRDANLTTDRGTHYARLLRTLWPWSLEVEEIDPFVDHYGPDYVRFRLTSLDGRTGYFDRFFGRERKCQQSGELGWCWTGVQGLSGRVVIVEGLADAISTTSSQYSGLALMGTGNVKLAPMLVPMIGHREIYLMLDGDGPGKKAELDLGRELLKMKKPFTLCRVPEGEDPASLGRIRANEILREGKRVRTLSELLSC